MKVTFIQNSTLGGPGLLGDYLQERGWSLASLVTYQDIVDTPFPSLEADLVVILGSPRGVYETGEAWISREHAMVEHLLAQNIPILGICFGAQLLAKVLGGEVRPMGRSYRDWIENDDVPSDVWRGPWLRWHGDRIYPPDKATIIARESVMTQAFRYGPTLGVQFHPEATPEILRAWIDSLPDEEKHPALVGPLAHYTGNAATIRARSFALFDAILQEIAPIAVPSRAGP